MKTKTKTKTKNSILIKSKRKHPQIKKLLVKKDEVMSDVYEILLQTKWDPSTAFQLPVAHTCASLPSPMDDWHVFPNQKFLALEDEIFLVLIIFFSLKLLSNSHFIPVPINFLNLHPKLTFHWQLTPSDFLPNYG